MTTTNIALKNLKKYYSDDEDSDNIFEQMLKEEINENGKISVGHQDGYLKVGKNKKKKRPK